MLRFAKQQQIVPRMTNGSISKICSSRKIFLPHFSQEPPFLQPLSGARAHKVVLASASPQKHPKTPSPPDISRRITHKNLPRFGAQAPGCFLPKGSQGQLSISAILASKLLTPGPKSLLWSVLELGHSIEIAFIHKTSLVCVVVEANASRQIPACNV